MIHRWVPKNALLISLSYHIFFSEIIQFNLKIFYANAVFVLVGQFVQKIYFSINKEIQLFSKLSF